MGGSAICNHGSWILCSRLGAQTTRVEFRRSIVPERHLLQRPERHSQPVDSEDQMAL